MSNDNAPNLSNCGLCGLKSDACKGHTPDEYSMTGNYWTGSFGQGEEFNFDWFLSHYNDRREALRAYVETTLRNGGTILQSFGPTKPTPLGDTLWNLADWMQREISVNTTAVSSPSAGIPNTLRTILHAAHSALTCGSLPG